jgi:hypothetical protein
MGYIDEPACKNCKFFSQDRVTADSAGLVAGECRLKSPQNHVVVLRPADHERGAQVESRALFPVVALDDWCGEFKLRYDW